MKTFRIRVISKGDENYEYSFYSFYNVEANHYSASELEARRRFCDDFGADFKDTEAYTFNKLTHEI